MSNATTLITGGAGFIGSHLAEALVERDQPVVALDSFDDFYDPRIKRRNLRGLADHPRFRLIEGDIRDPQALEQVFGTAKIATVIHLAARAGVRPSIADPVLYSSVNLDGTTRLLEAARHHGVERFVFASSSSVYGDNEKVPFSESDPVDHPISPYAATKKAGELLCHTYSHLFRLPVACLRLFTVYGPRQRPEMAIHKFARCLLEGRPIQQFGDGSSARDYTYVDDIVTGILEAMRRCSSFHVWNLGGSRTVRLSELVDLLARITGREPRIERLPQQPGDVDRTWADVRRAEQELGWRARVEIDEGLERFVRWLEAEIKDGAGGGARG